MSDRPRALRGAAAFLALLAASVLVAIVVVRARTPDLVLEVREQSCRVSSSGPGEREARISFFVRESDDDATIAIVDSREDVVRTLDDGVALAADEPRTYVWDLSTDAGAQAAPGRYRLLVELPGERREMIWPRRIFLDLPPGGACGSKADEGLL